MINYSAFPTNMTNEHEKKERDFFEFYQLNLPQEETQTASPDAPFEPKPKSKARLAWIGIFFLLFVLVGLAWVGSYLFGSWGTPDPVSLQIDGPRELASGNEAIYTLTIKNNRSDALSDVSLVASYPAGFEFSYASVNPKNSNKNYWQLGSLGRRERTSIVVRGTLHGIKGAPQKISFALYYKPKNANAEFTSGQSFDTTLTTSSLSVHLDGPTQLSQGEQGTYAISYDSFAFLPEKDRVELKVVPPAGFSISSVSPKPDMNYTWSGPALLKALDPLTNRGTITIIGSFGESLPEPQKMTVQMAIRDGRTAQSFPESEAGLDVSVRAGSLAVTVLVQGSTRPTALQLGEPIRVAIAYENKGIVPLSNLVLSAQLDSPLLNWATLSDKRIGIVKDTTISWTSKEVAELELIKPKEKGKIEFAIALKTPEEFRALPDEVKSLDPFFVITSVWASASAQAKNSTADEEDIQLEPITIKNPVNSDVQLLSSAIYSQNGSPLKGGALPPQVGQKTSYRVRFILTNTLHELESLKLSARLPNGVTASDSYDVTAGSFSYSNEGRTLEWTLNRLPAQVHEIDMYADLVLTPTSDQVGTQPVILSGIVLTARDKTTGGAIRLTSSDKTTSLPDDALAQGKGVVVP